MTRYFEDLAVGDTFEVGSHEVTRSEIVDFAERWDPFPFHVDEAAAAESMFGELVASGLHTICVLSRLFAVEFANGGEDVAIMGGRGIDDLRFLEPVRPGDVLALRIEVVDKRESSSRADRGYVDLSHTVFTDTGTVVLTAVISNIVRRAGGGGSHGPGLGGDG